MPRRNSIPLTKIHLWMFSEDIEYLDQICGDGGPVSVGRSRVVREIVHARVLDLKAQEQREFDRIRTKHSASPSTSVKGDSTNE